jgi:hypothetical protein
VIGPQCRLGVAPERLSGLADEAKELSAKHFPVRNRHQ